MPFDGSGNYTPLTPPAFPAVTGQTIVAGYYNSQINDLAVALSNCLTRDGQGKPSASINWNGQKITNLANGVNPSDAVNFSQLGGYALLGGATFTGALVGITLTLSGLLTANGGINSTVINLSGGATFLGNLTLGTNPGIINFTDTSGTHPNFSMQADNNLVFYATDAAGASRAVWSVLCRNSNSAFQINIPLNLTGVLTTGTAANSVGYLGIPQAAVHVANYQFVLADQSIDQAFNGANLVATIPANASVAFPIGAVLIGTNLNASSMTVAITTDTLIWSGTTTTGTRTIGQNGEFRARKVTATSWLITGTAMS